MTLRSFPITIAAFLAVACSESGSETPSMASTSGSGVSSTLGTNGTDGEDVMPPQHPRADLGFDPPQSCAEYCAALSECTGEAEGDCILGCSATYDERASEDGPCLDAHETLLSCVASLDCEEVAQHLADPTVGPCSGPNNDAELQCAVGDGSLSAACIDLCTTVQTCGWSTRDACEATCSQALSTAAEVGPPCVSAQEDLFACTAALSCEEYGEWAQRSGSYPCQPPDEAAEAACTGE
jgi:hypothetical protein